MWWGRAGGNESCNPLPYRAAAQPPGNSHTFGVYRIIKRPLIYDHSLFYMLVLDSGNKASLSFGRTSAGIVWCFWGMFHTIETTTMKYLISELALNYMNQKNIWYQISVKSCISIIEITSAQKAPIS